VGVGDFFLPSLLGDDRVPLDEPGENCIGIRGSPDGMRAAIREVDPAFVEAVEHADTRIRILPAL
jgi:hypothetical protein